MISIAGQHPGRPALAPWDRRLLAYIFANNRAVSGSIWELAAPSQPTEMGVGTSNPALSATLFSSTVQMQNVPVGVLEPDHLEIT